MPLLCLEAQSTAAPVATVKPECHLVPKHFIEAAHPVLPQYLVGHDLSAFRDFVRAGGRGELYYLRYAAPDGAAVRSLYMRVDSVPSIPLDDADVIALRDSRLISMWQKKLADGVPFLLTDKYRDYNGEVSAVGTPAFDLEQSCIFKTHPSVIVELTPDTTAYVFIHEFQHFNDNVYGRYAAIDKALSPLARSMIIYPATLQGETDELFALKRFILEQRAYATELRALRKQEKMNPTEFFRGRPDPKQIYRIETDLIGTVPFAQLENYELPRIKSNLRAWAAPVKHVLDRVNAAEVNNPGNLELVKNLLRAYCSPSDDVSLHQLLPEYF